MSEYACTPAWYLYAFRMKFTNVNVWNCVITGTCCLCVFQKCVRIRIFLVPTLWWVNICMCDMFMTIDLMYYVDFIKILKEIDDSDGSNLEISEYMHVWYVYDFRKDFAGVCAGMALNPAFYHFTWYVMYNSSGKFPEWDMIVANLCLINYDFYIVIQNPTKLVNSLFRARMALTLYQSIWDSALLAANGWKVESIVSL